MPTFILIGHCGPDMHLLKNAIARAVPGATIVTADDAAALAPHLKNNDAVLLINRVLDEEGFDTDSGIDFIARLAKSDHPPTMMLISNLADAQDAAVQAGARPGFGKRDVYAERTATLLREAARKEPV